MHSDKVKYEKLIAESPLFELDKKTQYTAYTAESRKMVKYLYLYLMAINAEKYGGYGLEITEVSTRCIQSFDGEKGEFLHYFNATWKKEFARTNMTRAEDEKYHGMHISENQRRSIRRVIRIAKSQGVEIDSPAYVEKLVATTGLSEEEIRELIELYNVSVVTDSGSNEDGEEFNVIDLFKSTDSAEESMIQSEKCIELLKCIDNVYYSLQERQRPMFSDVFTIKLCELLVGMDISVEDINFLNKDMIDEYKKTGMVLTQRDLAKKYDRDEASISRTIKEFIKKLDEVKEF